MSRSKMVPCADLENSIMSVLTTFVISQQNISQRVVQAALEGVRI